MENLNNLIKTIEYLRSENGCPWDRKQTLENLRKYIIEEVYELYDAIEREKYEDIIEEIGDVLLNLILMVTILKEKNIATLNDILVRLNDKIISRHPHVFGNEKARNADDAKARWDINKVTHEQKNLFEHIPKYIPALHRAYVMSKRAEKIGFSFNNYEEVRNKVTEELNELDDAIKTGENSSIEHEIGDVLISIANVSLMLDVNPENALHKCCERFIKRFEFIEKSLSKEGKEIFNVPREELERLWEKSKLEINI